MNNYLNKYLDQTQNITIVNSHKEPWQTQKEKYKYTGTIPPNAKHRTILKDEIIIELDYPTTQKPTQKPIATQYIKKISQFLTKQKINHHIIDWENSRSPHLRFRIQGLQYHTPETITQYKRTILTTIQQKIPLPNQTLKIDDMCTSHAHLCCLENTTHYKHNTPIKIIHKTTTHQHMKLNPKLIQTITKELQQEHQTNHQTTQLQPQDIKINKLKTFYKNNYTEGKRNTLICALAGQCKRIGLNQQQSLNILRATITNLKDDVPLKTREEEFIGTLKKDTDTLAVYHYFKKAFNQNYDDLNIQTKTKYQEFKLAFNNKELSITSQELLNTDVNATKYIIDQILYDEGFTYIAGPPKSFKTYFALYIATKIAKGEPILNKFNTPTPKKVLYIDEENRIKGMKKKYQQISNENIPNLYFLISPGCKLAPGEDTQIITEIERIKPELIIFDSLIRFSKGDENSSTEMKIVFDRIKHYITKYQTSIIMLHHTTKDNGNQNNGVLTSTRMRGSGDLAAQADTVIMMNKKPDNTFTINIDMDRYDEAYGPFNMTLKTNNEKFELNYDGRISNKNTITKTLNQQLKTNEWYTIEQLSNILETAIITTRKNIRKYVNQQLLKTKNIGRKKLYALNEDELEF